MNKLKKILSRIPTAWNYVFGVESNLESYAETEMKLSYVGDDDYTRGIRECVLSIVRMFALQGHSGFSAEATLSLAEKVMRVEPLTPIKGTDDEWSNVSDLGNENLYQNKRYSSVFKDNDGAYDIDGYVFVEPNGCRFTGYQSRKYITFPYYPDRAYITVPEDSTKEQQLEAIAKYEANRIVPL